MELGELEQQVGRELVELIEQLEAAYRQKDEELRQLRCKLEHYKALAVAMTEEPPAEYATERHTYANGCPALAEKVLRAAGREMHATEIGDKIYEQFGRKLQSVGSQLWREAQNPNSRLYKSDVVKSTFGLKEWKEQGPRSEGPDSSSSLSSM